MSVIAVLGLGHMGAAVARRMLAAGHQVTVWNRTAERARPFHDAGARIADSPTAAVAGAEVVVVMLTDAVALRAVLFGPDGAAAALAPGACLVQMSTIGPDDVTDLARRLPGVPVLDAPVAGSVAAVESGRLSILAGGDAEVLDRVAPMLASLGTLRRCGALGSGTKLKLVLNTALITVVAALADTLTVAEAVGVDRATALDALRTGPLGGAVDRATATGALFSVALAGKDLDLARQELAGASAPVVDAARAALYAVPDQAADLAALTTRK